MDGAARFNSSFMYAGLSILTFCAVVSVAVAWLNLEFPHTLDGLDIAGAAAPNYLRNGLELLSFLSTGVIIPGIAIWASVFGYAQAKEAQRSREEAENIRLSTVYITIVDRWNSLEIVTARKQLFDLVDAFRGLQNGEKAEFTDQSDYVSRHLRFTKATDRAAYRSYMVLLQFFEDLGLLCWKRYIRKEDIFDFIGSSIIMQMSILKTHLMLLRADECEAPNLTLFANAIYLYKEAVKFRPNQHQEIIWRDEPD